MYMVSSLWNGSVDVIKRLIFDDSLVYLKGSSLTMDLKLCLLEFVL